MYDRIIDAVIDESASCALGDGDDIDYHNVSYIVAISDEIYNVVQSKEHKGEQKRSRQGNESPAFLHALRLTRTGVLFSDPCHSGDLVIDLALFQEQQSQSDLPRLGFAQFRGQWCGVLEQDMVSLDACFQSQSNSQTGLASSWISNHNNILLALYELAADHLLQE